jgi:hypothetical protein
MTSRTITRYRCDWCGTRAAVPHGLDAAPPLPPSWERAQLRAKRQDLCKLCVDTLEAVLASGAEIAAEPVVTRAPRRHPSPLSRRLPGQIAAARPALQRTRRAIRDRVMLSVACAAFSLFAVASVVAATGMPGTFASPPAAHESTSGLEAAGTSAEGEASATGTAALAAADGAGAGPAGGAASAAQNAGGPSPDAAPGTPVQVLSAPADLPITAVGDSVMLAAAEDLKRDLKAIDIDAAVGRQAAGILDVLRARHAAGTLGAVVLLQVGNNGLIRQAQMDEMMGLLAEVPTVLLMNLHVAQPWEAPNNAMLAAAADRYSNVTLVDWASASHDRPDLFWDDEVHPRPPGAEVYTALITKELQTLGQSATVRQAATDASVPTPTATAAATRAAAPATAGRPPTLTLTAQETTQVTVTVDASVAFSGTLGAGQSQSWTADREIAVSTGNASGLLVAINGYSLGVLSAAVGHPDWDTLDWTWAADWQPR